MHRLRQPNQEAAWQRFVELYAPLIFHWARAEGMSVDEAADLVQDVLTLLIVKLPEFQYDPRQRFRGWLRTITANKVRDHQRRQTKQPAMGIDATLEHIASEPASTLSEDAEYYEFVLHRALELMQAEFRNETWQACWRLVVDGQSALDVAQELGLSLNSVYLAKSRVLHRLREELQDLMD